MESAPGGWPAYLRMDGFPDDQARRVRAIAIRAYCDPLIAADFNFLLGHEQDPMRWQSGPLEAAAEGR